MINIDLSAAVPLRTAACHRLESVLCRPLHGVLMCSPTRPAGVSTPDPLRICGQATKAAVGYLRPDWLARCAPLGADGTNLGALSLQIGQVSDPPCSPGASAGLLRDGRSSFPSGAPGKHAGVHEYTCSNL